jgi:hypothetical protein
MTENLLKTLFALQACMPISARLALAAPQKPVDSW